MEKFVVSARKYRPQAFDTVVGQEHITTTLKNAIKTGHLAHAFLFCGPRGVGKTTCARILAKTINCEAKTADAEACNTCNSCRSFNEGTSMNIHELDAASNNSVDDIRSLVEQVRFAPQAGQYKVYIIDEVHMLSSSAFNAFLKTLEEPPPYAIFILATTEKHKILPTILSRCQIFDFKRITLNDTVQHLSGIATKEGVTAEETALQLIAQKSEGCMRDALSILDKIVSFTGGTVSYYNTVEHLNILDADYYFKLLDCMLAQDLAGAMLLYDDINNKGFEGDAVLNGFAETLRNVLMCTDERVISLLEVVESFKQRYAEAAKKCSVGYLVSALNILADAEIGYKTARNKRLQVELALIKLCYLQQAIEITTADNGISKKKIVEDSKVMAYRQVPPIVIKEKTTPSNNPAAATLIIETEPQNVVQEPPHQPIVAPAPKVVTPAAAVSQNTTPPPPPKATKLGSLKRLQQQVAGTESNEPEAAKPLEVESLKKEWAQFIEQLKEAKNPAWQSFALAELSVTSPDSFEATATNNLQQKFLEMERNKAAVFLQEKLCNKALQFSIVLVEAVQENLVTDLPLSSKEQYLKLAEQYPLVKELRERLRMELDY